MGDCVSALRIQVSEQCKEVLDQLGSAYEFEDRGQVEVKVSCRSLAVFVEHLQTDVGFPTFRGISYVQPVG